MTIETIEITESHGIVNGKVEADGWWFWVYKNNMLKLGSISFKTKEECVARAVMYRLTHDHKFADNYEAWR